MTDSPLLSERRGRPCSRCGTWSSTRLVASTAVHVGTGRSGAASFGLVAFVRRRLDAAAATMALTSGGGV